MNVDEPGRGDAGAESNFTSKILKKIPAAARGHTVAAIGEFVGTM